MSNLQTLILATQLSRIGVDVCRSSACYLGKTVWGKTQ